MRGDQSGIAAMSGSVSRNLAKYWWLRCVACSEASMTTQMRGLGIENSICEQAMPAFSGGFMHLGHAGGLLTGASLAAGHDLIEKAFTEFADHQVESLIRSPDPPLFTVGRAPIR